MMKILMTVYGLTAEQAAARLPAGQQPGYSQGNPDDFSEIDDTDDLPF